MVRRYWSSRAMAVNGRTPNAMVLGRSVESGSANAIHLPHGVGFFCLCLVIFIHSFIYLFIYLSIY